MKRPSIKIRFETFLRIIVSLILVTAIPVAVPAQEEGSAALKYQMPPKELADLVDAPETPDLSLSPGGEWALLLGRASLPSISELALPELRLAGVRINPRNNGRSRGRFFESLILKRIADGSEKPITGLPEQARISYATWSPDGTLIAFVIYGDDAVQLWTADVATGKASQISGVRLSDTFYGSPFAWLPDSRTLVCKTVPEDQGPEPEAPTVPDGPVVQENVGKTAPAPTFQDLLKDVYDEALFEHYCTAQVMLVDVGGMTKPIGTTGIIVVAEPSPDGGYILVNSIHRPFSYLVPFYRFAHRVEVWDTEGNLVRMIADLPLAEEVPIAFDAVETGPRDFGWRQDTPATLYWVEAMDGGDPQKEADVRDRVFTLAAPFDGESVLLIDLGLRFNNIFWGSGDLALVNSRWWRTRWVKTWLVSPDDKEAEPKLVMDRSYEDRYNDPGYPMLRPNELGAYVLKTSADGNSLFLIGQGASPEGNRPFVDKLSPATQETARLWRSEAPYYEYPYQILDDEGTLFLTRRESVEEPPNYFVRDLAKGEIRPLTNFPHPIPQLLGVKKELITYQREDGVTLSATLYLPPGYEPGQGPLPMLMWAYPVEFKSADAAGQVRSSPYSFVRVSPLSALPFLLRGYAVLDNPTMPIIGEGEKEPNDTYVTQLVSSAKAAIDEMVRRGVADPERIAIGGHSYGAFMTANLLAHSDLFATGIARSGAYNRSLTPFGFQAEERTFWQAPEVYFAMSPFMHAEKINEPILLIHGQADNNSGTFPIQSERFYNALKGHGATVRLVMLSHESHGYRARESVLHMLWEMSEWLDKYVKNAGATLEH